MQQCNIFDFRYPFCHQIFASTYPLRNKLSITLSACCTRLPQGLLSASQQGNILRHARGPLLSVSQHGNIVKQHIRILFFSIFPTLTYGLCHASRIRAATAGLLSLSSFNQTVNIIWLHCALICQLRLTLTLNC